MATPESKKAPKPQVTAPNPEAIAAVQWPADSIKRVNISSLTPYVKNPRTHSPEQITQLANSMREWGWTNPVLVDEDGTIIAGHGRVQAAQTLGWKEAPVMVAKGWTAAQKQAYVITDNRLSENAGWDQELLRVNFGDLKKLDFDLALTGFEMTDIDELFNSEPEQQNEQVLAEDIDEQRIKVDREFLVSLKKYLRKMHERAPRSEAGKLLIKVETYLED